MAQRYTIYKRTDCKTRGIARIPGKRRGFTLIELLVVIAITSILLGLLFGPMLQSFNMVNRANAVGVAQDAVRYGLERMQRELAQAAYIFDNSNTPVVLPIGDQNGVVFADAGTQNALLPDSSPPFLFAKLDMVLAATAPAPSGGGSVIIDPTTNESIAGSRLVFPLAPGSRLVRYFIGLRDNSPATPGDVNSMPKGYQNVYEFPRGGQGFNPFILYRAEIPATGSEALDFFKPQNVVSYSDTTPNTGGFNDRNFFYNYNLAPNGKTYAENWKAVASPVLSGDRLDVLAWNRTANRQISTTQPFRTIVSFQPATVTGDTATPGYLTDAGNMATNAVPTVYNARHGQWVRPFTVTVYRGSTRQRSGTFGALRVQVYDWNGKVVAQPFRENGSTNTYGSGSLEVSNYRYAYDPARQTMFIDAGEVTFIIDPQRGRIITGLPPLALQAVSGPEVSLTTTFFRVNTRHPDAGSLRPLNAGLLQADLKDAQYYPVGSTAFGSPLASPLTAFDGGLLVPGSERVMGPSSDINYGSTSGSNPSSLSYSNLMPYHRVSAVDLLNRRNSQTDLSEGGNEALKTYQNPPAGPLAYVIENDLDPRESILVFDKDNTVNGQGLWAAPASASDEQQKYLEVNYLWQNNFARKNNPSAADDNMPIDVNGNYTAANANAPEADVMKLEYRTRSLLNLALGVRVYDASSRVPQTVQVTDRVKINNPTR